MRVNFGNFLGATLFSFVAAGLAPVGAADVPFAGTWASDKAQCANDQSKDEAPLILTDKTYDQHEAHCTFSSVAAKGEAWDVKARCSVEGDSQDGTFEFSVDGDTLVIADEGGRRVLTRCR